jgi:methanogenic corrinoid protein MtbC1
VAQTLVKIIMDQVSDIGNKKKVLICVPLGEEHHLGCDVLETYLSIKGYKVYNIGTSIPTESILSFIDNNKPDVILISITLEDNIAAGQRLVRKLKDQHNIPILIGGFAFQGKKIPKFDGKIISDIALEEIPKIIRTA